jgi:O-antigen/teichoic acid export membrane protein
MEASGDVRSMLDLNSRANIMIATIVCPLLGFAFAFADDLVTLVYTAAYAPAAPVMRVYIVGLAAQIVETASITMLLRQGPFVMGLNLAALVVAIALDWWAASRFGLAGAAVGSVMVIYLDRLVTLRRIASLAGMPMRKLQNWDALATRLILAALAAALAWGIVGRYLPAGMPIVRLSIGAMIVALSYAAMTELLGAGRARFAAARGPGRGG